MRISQHITLRDMTPATKTEWERLDFYCAGDGFLMPDNRAGILLQTFDPYMPTPSLCALLFTAKGPQHVKIARDMQVHPVEMTIHLEELP